jgi:metallo-beta-lactamase class B
MFRMSKIKKIIYLSLVIILIVLYNLWQNAIAENRSIPIGPFQIVSNLYYVGTTSVTSFLLTSQDGHVLIDGAYPESASMIVESIKKLGYKIEDVKVILNSHAHPDHAGSLAKLVALSGAEVWSNQKQKLLLESGGKGDPTFGPIKYLQFFGFGTFDPVKVDKIFNSGDTLNFGPITLIPYITAGHTQGNTSWAIPIKDGDQTYLAVSIGSLTMSPFMSFVEPETYPGIRSDFEESFRTLRDLPVDIFLASHANWFKLHRKFNERDTAINSVSPFLDRKGYLKFIDYEEKEFIKERDKQIKIMRLQGKFEVLY